ncbi:hypothetical protein AVEN_122005-1 [Araneus ventricosus]|uniref:Uncharacterized protein n=1 Tax=Araneus ventricosus TaxID=182803 RepID=A0A4Y2QXW6_ARAVE|nr:hypothetical protein AVEN_122005-1 [Araneus ventricosus]
MHHNIILYQHSDSKAITKAFALLLKSKIISSRTYLPFTEARSKRLTLCTRAAPVVSRNSRAHIAESCGEMDSSSTSQLLLNPCPREAQEQRRMRNGGHGFFSLLLLLRAGEPMQQSWITCGSYSVSLCFRSDTFSSFMRAHFPSLYKELKHSFLMFH